MLEGEIFFIASIKYNNPENEEIAQILQSR